MGRKIGAYVCGLLCAYCLRLVSQMSKTGRLLGSTEVKAIPIPPLGREKATVPWPVKLAPA